MLNSAVQVSVGYLTQDKPKTRQTRKEYFRLYYLKHRQKLLTKRKAYYWNNKSLLWNDYFTCKKPFCLTCASQGIKENQYKFCGDSCSVQYWISIYSQIYSKKEKNVEQFSPHTRNDILTCAPANRLHVRVKNQNVEQFSPHTRNDILTSKRAPANRLHVRVKNSFLFFNTNRTTALLHTKTQNQSKLERRKRKDQAWRRLATKDKVAQTAGYNLPTYKEKRTLDELLKRFGEYSYLTGKPLGNYYLSTLDIDLKKEEFSESMIARLESGVEKLTNCLRVSYDKTKKGLHVDILTPKPLNNEIVYYQGWKKTWNIGSIQSKGKYVVGEDKEKEFIDKGKWYWKVEKNEEIKARLAKFFFILGKQQANKQQNSTRKIPSQPVLSDSTIQQIKQIIQAKIISLSKTRLTDFLKVFYWDPQNQKRGYFLLNTYQRSSILPNLNVGSLRSALLTRGTKHKFLNRLL